MGKTTKFFRQSAKSLSGNSGARNFSQVIRSEGWHMKIANYIKAHSKNISLKKGVKLTKDM